MNFYKGKLDKRFATLVDIIYDTTNEFKKDDGKVDEKSRVEMLTDLRNTLDSWLKEAKPQKRWWQFWK